MKTIESADLEGEKVALRTDLNLPIEDGEPQKTVRFERYLDTIKELRQEGAKTVVMAHQGRPGRDDFTSLEKHAELLSESLGQDVKFVKSFFGSELDETLEAMSEGDVALLENVRFLSEELKNLEPEKHAEDIFVRRFAEKFDVYVNDAFSAAHRSHGSIVGFMPLLETYAGRVMKEELENCGRVRDELENPVLVLGGEKPSDIVSVLEQMVEKADKVLLGGVPGELALMIEGQELGEKAEWIREHGFDEKKEELEELMDEHGEKFVLPEDLETGSGNFEAGKIPEDEMTWDIGEETREKFRREILDADSVLLKGPMGAFEDHPDGSQAVIDAIAETEAFAVMGGGHTSSLVKRFDHELDEFNHVSIAGGAFVKFMSGEKLEAVEALENYS